MGSKDLVKIGNLAVVRAEYEALSSQKANECEGVRLDAALLAGVTLAYEILGYSTNEKAMEEKLYNISTLLMGEVLEQCPYIRIDEILIAIKKGCYGEYGDFAGISVATIVKFLKEYYRSSRRSEMVKATKVQEEDPIPSPEEMISQENEIIMSAFDKHSRGVFFEDFGSHVYNILDRRGLIRFSNQRKSEFMEAAKKSLKARHNIGRAVDMVQKKAFKKALAALERADSKNTDGNMMVVREAKRIALQTYFEELTEIGSTIEDELNGQAF